MASARDAIGSPPVRDDRLSRVIGAALTVVFGVPLGMFLWMALSSRFGSGSVDPHGYAMIFGAFLALITGILVAFAVPLIFPRRRRAAVYLWSLIGYLVVAGVLILALITA